ncbi:hypothetical protein RvY_01606 [Ramazzottius varieornatus]|uniref:Uncharacterized protein n=1 Tax=Ramazzottius varieornatus TaxID=947166 RepID=A0A1D1UP06_RAMVA|nr:hypothetical protein RvY_01606 [Ramazzottius varieornatus]
MGILKGNLSHELQRRQMLDGVTSGHFVEDMTLHDSPSTPPTGQFFRRLQSSDHDIQSTSSSRSHDSLAKVPQDSIKRRPHKRELQEGWSFYITNDAGSELASVL